MDARFNVSFMNDNVVTYFNIYCLYIHLFTLLLVIITKNQFTIMYIYIYTYLHKII